MESKQVIEAVRSRASRRIAIERVDERGEIVVPRGIKRGTLRVTQALVERGVAPPWAMSRERCQSFWAAQDSGPNAPSTYAMKPTEIVDCMREFWGPDVEPSDRVLEVGCNAGTNLERLRGLGFTELEGIEINESAVAALRESYPDLAGQATIRVASIEDGLGAMEPNSVDVVFSMAVLLHLHPTSDEVFDELVRVSRGCVSVIELEYASNNYVFPRDYRRVFESRGCVELRSDVITPETYPAVSRAYDGYVARLFRTPV